ncbi:MAG: Rpn family recombination-promoting nuclease/putative transposase [Holosporales bacterium]|jgi:hypothetical protein|nr:Rpn family recombination-promoting nuclease/putative transposase [Holosporales bacterium]
MERFLNPRNDWIFKRVFGTEQNKDILIGFLNAVFEGVHEPIEDVEFLPSHQNPEIAVLRQSIVDVKCTDIKNRKFIVEMQCYRDPDFIKRACLYASRAYFDQLTTTSDSRKEGAPQGKEDGRKLKEFNYSKIKPVIFLAILYDFTLIPDEDGYISHNKIFDTKTHKQHIKEFSYSFLELDKFQKSFEESKTLLEKWCYFFKNAEWTLPDEVEEMKKHCPVVGKAYDALERYSYTPEEYEAYLLYDMGVAAHEAGIRCAREEGVAEGLEKGVREGVKKVAISMLRKGLTVETVSDYTGLSIEQINALKHKSIKT